MIEIAPGNLDIAHDFVPQRGTDECAVCSMSPEFHRVVLTEVPDLPTEPEPQPAWWRLVPCPLCKSPAGQACVTKYGSWRVEPHRERVA